MKRSSTLPDRFRRHCFRWLALGATGLAITLAGSPARAQMAHLPDNDWRQADRHDTLARTAKRSNVYVELRFGPYLPSLATSGDKGSEAFNNVFGTDCSSTDTASGKAKAGYRFYVGTEVDWLPLRIPYVGGFGFGLGWGFTRFGAKAQFLNNSSMSGVSCSEQSTTLTIMPMHGSFVLRVDEILRRTGIPIVPYGKAGVGLTWWRAGTDTGTEHICKDGSGGYMPCTAGQAEDATGMGLTPSLHLAVGGMLSLNFLEPRTSATLAESTGIGHVYLFGEFFSDSIRFTPSKSMNVGTTGWTAGLAIDL
ncbi:hypothetical protein A7982_12080 [Minicystis rosea]|nr:hypothetical protein A7982_12080 [Minicystis rosea]